MFQLTRDFEIKGPDGSENIAKKWICAALVLIAIIIFLNVVPTLLCQMLVKITLLELNSWGPFPSSEREIKFVSETLHCEGKTTTTNH